MLGNNRSYAKSITKAYSETPSPAKNTPVITIPQTSIATYLTSLTIKESAHKASMIMTTMPKIAIMALLAGATVMAKAIFEDIRVNISFTSCNLMRL